MAGGDACCWRQAEAAIVKGFTLVELLVAMAITLVVAAATLSLIGPAHDAFQVQPETTDLYQRTRVASMLTARPADGGRRHVRGRRCWSVTSGARAGHAVSCIWIRLRRGAGNYFRTDAISLLFVPSTAVTDEAVDGDGAGWVGHQHREFRRRAPPRPLRRYVGLAAGDQVLVFDRAGDWEVFTVDRMGGDATMTLKGSAADSAPLPRVRMSPRRLPSPTR
jgi:prepilin-type N-terminal cleavage/methylation domain-containing protein